MPDTRFQAEHHWLYKPERFTTIADYVLHLMHIKAYESAAPLLSDPVIDVGCNMGYGTAYLRKHGRAVTGVDVSRRAVEHAQMTYGGEFILVDGTSLPFDDGSFGSATSFQVIEHIPDLRPYLSEIARVLRSGGQALFTTPNAITRLDPGQPPWNRFHVQEFTPDSLRGALEPYFADVKIYGLTGSDSIISIEAARVGRLRAAGRVRAKISRFLPSSLENALIEAAKGARRRIRRPLNDAELSTFSTADLRFSADDVHTSVCLLAICRS